jgi:hypothetical protein
MADDAALAGPVVICEVCGLPVVEAEAVRAELTAGGMTCPTALTFHRPCYERASEVWGPSTDTSCTAGP